MARIIICTHHKAGTVWMGAVFRQIAAAAGLPFVRIANRQTEVFLPPGPAIVLAPHAGWLAPKCDHLRDPADRLFHVIRDPRDVIISAARYHVSATEAWLLRPDPELGGRTYHDALNAVQDEEGRLAFEMDRASGRVIGQMATWDYGRADCIETTYEALIADASCDLFGSIAVRLGLGEDLARRAFWDQSLFGGLAGKANPVNGHVRSGAVGQWRSVFSRPLAERFLSRFGDLLIRLGYEPDHCWIDGLPASRV